MESNFYEENFSKFDIEMLNAGSTSNFIARKTTNVNKEFEEVFGSNFVSGNSTELDDLMFEDVLMSNLNDSSNFDDILEEYESRVVGI